MNKQTPLTTHQYSFAVNDPTIDGSGDESVTMQIVKITTYSARQRCVLFRKFLKHTYGLTRKQANKSIRALGFFDLLPDTYPACVD
ncbi:MAG: hypothetical protein KAS32_11895 [Candidatus Peribacteraceae bacterium]|nr:hypothetical protein [Candidatus Peribacteraceae bacterium]